MPLAAPGGMKVTVRILLVLCLTTLGLGCGRRMTPPPSTPPQSVSMAIPAPVPPPAEKPLAEKDGDPRDEFRIIVARMKEKGTPARAVPVAKADRTAWERRRFEAVDIVYEIKKTGLDDVPYEGEIRWKNIAYVSPRHASKDQAERESNETAVVPEEEHWHALFEYRDNRWQLRDVGWTTRGMERSASHRMLAGEEDGGSIHDWYNRLVIVG